uniref:Uncharacterized protein n=1 Tax=Arundo donax TaxID=35708 RepID=A0A0A9FTH6_ARUDO
MYLPCIVVTYKLKQKIQLQYQPQLVRS